jgi:hypothetical protein
MQKCLNEEYKEDIKCLSNPFCCTFVVLTLLVAIIFPGVAVYCLNSRTCPPYMGEVFLAIGINIDFFIVMFIIIPCSSRVLLNCCYYEPEEPQEPKEPRAKKAPKVPKEPKVPREPKSKPPNWAFVSFSDSVKGRSKSLNYTENPLTAKEKAASRSRSRSKSDSEV